MPSIASRSSAWNDGTAAAGNSVGDYSYETFRWTRAGGVERLGLATFPVISRAAGTPNISYSGNQVSASILSSDYQLTQGLWDLNSGWTECMPPVAPGGALVDDGYGSAWGLSGNGQVVTGFFWSENYRAQASAWSATTGIVALGQQAVDGSTTEHDVYVDTYPTHSTALPVAVNIQCHSARTKEAIL